MGKGDRPKALHRGDAESIGGCVRGDRLGSGGMGVGYLGRSASGRQVAVTAVRASDGKQLWQRATEIENLPAPVLSPKSHTLCFANRFDTVPYALLVKDALVAVAGDTAFSVRTDRPVLPCWQREFRPPSRSAGRAARSRRGGSGCARR
ncbi:hypothetical protein [Streptomyces sp. NPDC050548]|uniref:hypothetical protein n=1 Tax=Streptomyces sp. NPDC050548 TaxID=3365629 RepID=UPI0037A254B3